jgi:autotransporter-associated beta strand protein
MKRTIKPLIFTAPVAVMFLLTQGQNAGAAGGNWNVDAGGSWNTAGNWSPAAVPGTTAGDVVGLTYNITAARIVTNNAAVTLGTLNIGDADNSAAYNLTNTGGSLTFNNSGNGAQLNQVSTSKGDTISTAFALGDNLTVNNGAGNTLTLSGIISGSKAINISSSFSGLINLTAANTFTGGITNIAGTIGISQGPNLGATPSAPTNQFNFAGNSTLQFEASIAAGSAISVNRSFQINNGVTGAVDLNGYSIFTKNQWKSIGTGAVLFENSSATAGILYLGNNSAEADDGNFGAAVAAGATLSLNRQSSASIHCIGGNGLTVRGGTVQVTGIGGDQIYDGAPVTVNVGTFDLRTNETIGSLAGLAGVVTNGGTVASILTIGGTLGTGAGYYEGNIRDNAANGGTLSVVKAGSGTLVLGGTNIYAGSTTVTNGTLQLQPTPTVPYAGSLAYQLDASALGLANGAAVSSVPDGSGNGNSVTPYDPANPPTYNSSGLNGKGTIHFTNNANIGLQTAGAFSISGSASRSVFTVMVRPSGGQILLSWGSTTAGNLFDVTIGNSGLYYLPAVYSGGDNTFSTPSVDTHAHLCEALYDGNVSESGYLDGSLLGTKTIGSALSTTAAPLQIGYRSGDSNKALGDVAEILIYNTALTATQRQQVEAYLLNKWLGSTGGPANVLPTTTTVNLASGAILDLNGTPQTVVSLSDISGSGGMVTNSSAATPVRLTLDPTSGSTTFSGNISDNGGANAISLTVKGTSGTQVLAGANTYNGNTTISGGTLALGSSGSINNTPNLSIAAGATLDVSAITTYDLSASTSLTASGTGATVGSTAAAIKGGTTVSLGSVLVTLNFTPTAFLGDSTHPALTVVSGALNLGTSTITVINNGGSPMGAGDYTVISGGTVNGTPTLNTLSGVGSGAGLALGTLPATLVLNSGNLILHVSTSLAATTNTIALHTGWTSSSTYGDALQFDVIVTGYDPSGTVTLQDGGVGGTTIGTGTLSGGSVTITVNPLNSLTAGTHNNIVAVYGGDGNNSGSASSALSPAQVVNAKTLTVSGATALSKYYDGTTNAIITGTLVGVLSGDTATLNGTGYFASSVVGTGISVTSTSTLGGASGSNYSLNQPTGLSANIYASGVWTGAAADTIWDTVGNWSSSLVPSGANVTADFSTLDITSDQTVNLNSPRTIGNLVFGDTDTSTAAGWTLANHGIAGNTLTLAGTAPTITVNSLGASKNVTISAVVAGTSGLTKTGSGTLALSGANTFGGGTTISGGTVQFISNANLGNTNSSVILNGGTLASAQTAQVTMTRTIATGTTGGTIQLNNGAPTNSNNEIVLYTTGQFSGNGPITLNNNGFVSIGGVNTGYSGNWTLNGGVVELVNNFAAGSGAITVNAGAELSTLGSQITNALTLNSGTIGWDYYSGSGNYEGPVTLLAGGGTVSLVNFYFGGGAMNGTISGLISGSGELNISATGLGGTTFGGVLTLSGNNSYTGGTMIGAGTTIQANGSTALGDSANALLVAGTLNLNGNSLTQGALTISGGATFDFTLGAGSANQLRLTSASVSGTNYIGINASGMSGTGTYNLISATGGGLTGTFLFVGATNSLIVNNGSNVYYLLTLNNTDTAEQILVSTYEITNGINIMPFGSSITAGQSAQSPYEGGGYRTGLYLDLVADGRFTPNMVGSDINLLANSPTNVNPLTTANQLHHEGHPGWTTLMMLANINANDGNSGGNGGYWLAPGNGVNPNYITVNIGGNDAVDYGTDSATLASAAQRLDATVSDFYTLRSGVDTIVSTICYRGDGGGAYSVGLDAYYNPAISGIVFNHVLAGQNVGYLNLRNLMNYPADIGSDLIHPTQAGYDKMGSIWYQSLTYGAAYWTGGQDRVWNTVNGTSSNWTVDRARTQDRQKSLDDAATITYGIYPDVYFNTNTGPLSTTLGADTTIRSLNFTKDATGSVTIGAGNTLTIGSIDTSVIAGTTYSLMNSGGITVQAGSGSHTLAANVVLGANQTWGNVSSNPFIVSGAISGTNGLTIVGAYTLFNPGVYTPNPSNNTTYATYTTTATNYIGTGSIVLAGNNSYTGGTIVNSGTLVVNDQSYPNSGTGSSAVSVNAGGTLSGNGRIAGSVNVANATGSVLYPNNIGGGTLILGGNLAFGGSSAGAEFNLSVNNASGNDQIVLENTTLVCGGAQITISNISASVLSTSDYVLVNAGVSGTISGSFNSTPVWVGTVPKYSSQYSILTVGNTVVLHYTPINITVAAATAIKNYDGTTETIVAPTLTAGALAAGDSLNGTESFSDKNTGVNKILTPAGTIIDVSNNDMTSRYNIMFNPANTGVINATNITVSAATNTKTYDATINAAAMPTVTSGSVQPGDRANFTETYDTKNVGVVKTLTPSGIVSDGNSGNNYSVTFVNDTTGVIGNASLTIMANSTSKVYGQNLSFAGTEFTTSSLLTGDSVSSVTLTSSGAANAAPVNTYDIVPSNATGGGLGNYTINYVNGTLTVTAATTVIINPPLVLGGGTVQLTFTGGDAGVNYRIQGSTDLTTPNWSTLITNTAGTNGLPAFTDLGATNYIQRFYRTVTP